MEYEFDDDQESDILADALTSLGNDIENVGNASAQSDTNTGSGKKSDAAGDKSVGGSPHESDSQDTKSEGDSFDASLVNKTFSHLRQRVSGLSTAKILRRVAAIVAVIATLGGVGWLISYEVTIHRLIATQQATYQEYGFNPGRIITDAKFFDSMTMTEPQIQSFLNEKGASCTQQACLRSETFDTHDWTASEGCTRYVSRGKQTAAQIVFAASKACGINPQVFLVMLQKEQGLVTATQPGKAAYSIAMGLSCPDNAACDRRYSGFFNQVFGAAKRFQYYKHHLSRYPYQVNHINSVRYNPSEACGAKDIYIQNTATALLYTYTPYQPDESALKSIGNSCSSWGNLNFARLYRQWFGDTQ
ncbi:MAG: hemagglutinin [Bifidobacteriaceae bacterium]|nr:hemagglutinin [Bifidobacteriaceae bacterium]